MTPEELREKVARALFRSAVDDGGHINGFLPYNQQPEATQRHYECLADAAISVVREAMREPSEEMLDAWEKLKHPPHHENRLATKQANIYRAMLAASPLRPASRRPRAMQVETSREAVESMSNEASFDGRQSCADMLLALLSERDAATARAEAAEREASDARMEMNRIFNRSRDRKNELVKERDAATAERDRLREALEGLRRVATCATNEVSALRSQLGFNATHIYVPADIARAALAGAAKEPSA